MQEEAIVHHLLVIVQLCSPGDYVVFSPDLLTCGIRGARARLHLAFKSDTHTCTAAAAVDARAVAVTTVDVWLSS